MTSGRRTIGTVVKFVFVCLLVVGDPVFGFFMTGRHEQEPTAVKALSSTITKKDAAAVEARLIARKLRACDTIQQGWEIVREYQGTDKVEERGEDANSQAARATTARPLLHESVAAALLNLCGKTRDADAALEIVKLVPTSSICRSRAISILGTCGRHVDALNVLTAAPSLDVTGPYNSAIAASGKAKDWEAVSCILQDMPVHLVTTVTLNAALTALRKARRGDEAWELLGRAAASPPWWPRARPDRASYHITLSCVLERGEMERACRLVRTMERQPQSDSVQPNPDTYRRIAAAVADSPEHWQIVQRLLPEKVGRELPPVTAFQKWKLKKCFRGKNAYWELGTLRAKRDDDGDGDNDDDLVVALQPNRNPAVNGMKLAFYRQTGDDTDQVEKLGYLLMINSHQNRTSQFLGQFVDQSSRGQGLAKIWLAVWFRLCLDAGLRPMTGKIRKPILCLILQSSFGMIPQSGGIEAVLSPGEKEGETVLYSPSGQSLEGAVSPLDLRHQNIRLSLDPPEVPGRTIVLNCDFVAPDTDALEATISPILQDRFTLHELAQQEDLCQILLGA